jgi:pantoate--beta-alanine ligase
MTAIIKRIAEWNKVAAAIRREEVLGLVPTMGALHAGHGALLDEARRHCAVVVASIFVNRLQFNQRSDYDLYPRVLEDDVAFCMARGVDYIFASSDDEMYPEPQRVFVEVEGLSEHLCGQNRPGHFRGVATVVLKLFQVLQPRFAFFGEKDYQQLAVVRRLVHDLNIPLQVVGVSTVRERARLRWARTRASANRGCAQVRSYRSPVPGPEVSDTHVAADGRFPARAHFVFCESA